MQMINLILMSVVVFASPVANFREGQYKLKSGSSQLCGGEQLNYTEEGKVLSLGGKHLFYTKAGQSETPGDFPEDENCIYFDKSEVSVAAAKTTLTRTIVKKCADKVVETILQSAVLKNDSVKLDVKITGDHEPDIIKCIWSYKSKL